MRSMGEGPPHSSHGIYYTIFQMNNIQEKTKAIKVTRIIIHRIMSFRVMVIF